MRYYNKNVPCQITKETPENYCLECGSDITKGDKFYDLNGYKIHKGCIKMIPSTNILDFLEIKPQVL